MGEKSLAASFEIVYEENFKYIYNFIYMRVLHKETCEDLTSETFTNAFKSYESYDPSKASIRTWLCAIALNTILMLKRKASTRNEIASDTLPENPYNEEMEYLYQYDINREAENILSHLSGDEREIISLRLAAELSFKEIAEVLNTTEKAAAERYRRIIIKCRKYTSGKSMDDFL
ncbi:MAG: sigma-70 family RNA polymerase sigma factor [Butyrivibrio sp.]|nr:sigma-70 family RNA polymerase sigma factor [Butyrivibrio sp.]